MCNHNKLIGRDDAMKFDSRTEEQRVKDEYEALLSGTASGLGGDATLNMKNFLKSLSSLAGDDDTIFAIIDDRSDVWTQEKKNSEGKTIKEVS
jgi:hypothetical protein